MRVHSYKHKTGTYYKGRSRGGRYYTRQGCLLPILSITLLIGIVIYFV